MKSQCAAHQTIRTASQIRHYSSLKCVAIIQKNGAKAKVKSEILILCNCLVNITATTMNHIGFIINTKEMKAYEHVLFLYIFFISFISSGNSLTPSWASVCFSQVNNYTIINKHFHHIIKY